MKSPKTIFFVASFVIFLSLVYFNYSKAQTAIRQTQPSPLSISLVSIPERVKEGNSGSFIWSINASTDLNTSFTTIYWGYVSTPSALTKTDSPLAVGYSNYIPDYTKGVFKLPGSFDLSLPFTKAGRVFFRAYAHVKNNHLWTEEKYIDIIK